ncbi:MAG: hypothetical protein J6D21_03615 [Clostridia bacterium]|nr:hypothetical protein [Clostridia bacterium]
MKRLLSLVLALALLTALMGCGQTPADTTPTATPDVTTPTQTTPTQSTPVQSTPVQSTPAQTPPALPPSTEEAENPISYLTVSLGEDYSHIRSITVYLNDDGSTHVEYVGEVKKVADLDGWVLHSVTLALMATGLKACNGQEVWVSGDANGSLYVSFADGTYWGASYGGSVPAAFRQAYAVLDAYMAELTAPLPVYVPQPLLLSPVEDKYIEELMAIFRAGKVQDLDAFTVDSSLSHHTLGLSSGDSIRSSAYCAAMMMTTPYSLTLVTVKEGVDARDVCKDFEEHIDWTKWVCVLPSNAMIAVKGDLVLCLLGSDALYTQTAAGIETSGWTVYRTLRRPN